VSGRRTGPDTRKSVSDWAGATLVILSGVAAVAAAVVLSGRQHELAASAGRGADIPSGTASLLRLSPASAEAAPGFTLTDQDGRVLSLSGFRGRAVVLEFMDSRCTDICPLVSREFVDAYHDLGKAGGRVVFVAVNVNQRYNRVADVLAYSQAHELSAIPDWHFFTGSGDALRAVWREYGIAVTASGPGGDLVHTATVYFIGPHGVERYTAAPSAEPAGSTDYLPPAEISGWGKGIAQVALATLG
jgi:protein SCO1